MKITKLSSSKYYIVVMYAEQFREVERKKGTQMHSYFHSFMTQSHTDEVQESQNEQYGELADHLLYFDSLFSVKDTTQSIQKRNQNLYQIKFDCSDSEPEDIYMRRKNKVSKLQSKEQTQLSKLSEVRELNYSKYQAIVTYMKFLFDVKKKISCARTDYYSTKTFSSLINSSDQDIISLIKLLKRILSEIMNIPFKYWNQEEEKTSKNLIDSRLLEFLILPRFLISKQKITRLLKDQNLQNNFIFLISNLCLGHYNNEANKKMPQNNKIEYLKELLKKSKGREKFQKICSINHGNKFLKNYQSQYYDLYFKSYDYLQFVDHELRRGKKYHQIKKELRNSHIMETQETQNSQAESYDNSFNRVSFRSLKSEFTRIKISEGNEEASSIYSFNLSSNSDVITHSEIKEQPELTPVFRVKKSSTMNYRTQNIILVKPSHEA